MNDPRLDEVQRLIASPDAPRRLFGLLRLEERLGELDVGAARKVLARARSDADPRVREVGKRLEATCDAIEHEDRFPDGGRSVFQLLEGDAEDAEVALLDDHLPEALGSAADLLLEPCLDGLQVLLVSPKADMRRRAVLTAGALRHPRFLPYLEECARDEETALEVVEALDGWAIEPARRILREVAGGDSTARIPALAVLAAAGDPEAYGLLEFAAADPDPQVRAGAAGGLAHSTDEMGRAVLRRLLDDRDPGVVLAAIESWGYQRDPAAVTVLLERLRADPPDGKIKASLLACLRDMRSEEALEVARGFVGDPDDRVRANAVEAVAAYEFEPETAKRLFEPLLQDPTARVRGNAIVGLFLNHPPAATDAMVELFASHEANLRQAAAYCAGMMQSQRATETLALMMRTEQDARVLGTGLRAMARIRGKLAVDVLREFAESSFGESCVGAIHHLADLGDVEALPTLARLAREAKEAGVRAAAVHAVGEVAPSRAANYLPRSLADPNPRVVANAIEGLEASGNLEAIPLLTPLLRSDVARIRANACTGLWHLGEFSALEPLGEMLLGSEDGPASSALFALGRIGVSLRVAELARRPLLTLALGEAHRRAFPDQPRRRAPPPPPPPPEDPEEESPVTGADLMAASSTDRADPAEVLGPGDRDLEDAALPSEGPDARPPAKPSTEAENAALRALALLDEPRSGPGAPLGRDHLPEDAEAPGAEALLQVALERALDEGDADAVAAAAQLARHVPGECLPTLYALARESRRAGNVEESLRFYLKIARAQTAALSHLAGQGEEALATRDLESAERAARLLSSMLHFVPRFHALMGDYLLGQRRYEAARRHLLHATLGFPDDALLALKLASASLRAGMPRLARASADLASRRDPGGAVGDRARALLVKLGVDP